MQNGGLLPCLIEDDGQRADDAGEADGDSVDAIHVQPQEMTDEQAVAASSKPPAQRTRQQRQGVTDDVAAHPARTERPSGVACNEAHLAFDQYQGKNSGNDISQKDSLDAPAHDCNKQNAKYADAQRRQDPRDGKRTVITQSAEHLGVNLLKRQGDEQASRISQIMNLGCESQYNGYHHR